MSREIKFRAWVKPLKRYANGIDTILYHKACDVEGGGIWSVVCEEWDSEVYECDNIVVEQYTGLKDKNGKEIYEGDRIKIEGSDTIYTVEYGRGVWVARFGDESGDNICLFHYVQKDTVLYAEVIGNIHENPELLEVNNGQ